jgi:hypothetical protein
VTEQSHRQETSLTKIVSDQFGIFIDKYTLTEKHLAAFEKQLADKIKKIAQEHKMSLNVELKPTGAVTAR